MKIPLGSCKSYAKRNIPWESAKWDLQNKRCAKYTLEKRAHPNDHGIKLGEAAFNMTINILLGEYYFLLNILFFSLISRMDVT